MENAPGWSKFMNLWESQFGSMMDYNLINEYYGTYWLSIRWDFLPINEGQ